ncbi:FadR/GntR family transcriptional regulator [Amycolatopsis mediterranei]|uniref:FadR/GntR family transcriptional regulator n=1 Tax=Amycolatopsis mediterranei TaxID=33910 RepID=UPI003420A176
MTASDRQPAAPDWVRRPANLASAVTAELVGRVVRGVHPSGSSLPAEPVLCESFSVSRTVVREAVKLLQAKGLVQVRQGAGTVVNPASMWNMLDELVLAAVIAEDETSAVLDDLVVTRRLLEADMALVAARTAGPEVVARLGELVDLMDELVDDPVAYREQDLAFHDTIMQVSGNRLARGVVRALESQVVNTARYVGPSERALCVASNRGHRRVYERIAAGDGDGAAKAMFDHITEAWLARRPESGDPGRLER